MHFICMVHGVYANNIFHIQIPAQLNFICCKCFFLYFLVNYQTSYRSKHVVIGYIGYEDWPLAVIRQLSPQQSKNK